MTFIDKFFQTFKEQVILIYTIVEYGNRREILPHSFVKLM